MVSYFELSNQFVIFYLNGWPEKIEDILLQRTGCVCTVTFTAAVSYGSVRRMPCGFILNEVP